MPFVAALFLFMLQHGGDVNTDWFPYAEQVAEQ